MKITLAIFVVATIALFGCAKKTEAPAAPPEAAASAAATEAAAPAATEAGTAAATEAAPAAPEAAPAATTLTGQTFTVTLKPVAGSGVSGTATLVGFKYASGATGTAITIKLSGAPAGTSLPVDIVKGGCANLWPNALLTLPPVVNGASKSEQPSAPNVLDEMAIVVHASAANPKKNVACGDIHTLK